MGKHESIRLAEKYLQGKFSKADSAYLFNWAGCIEQGKTSNVFDHKGILILSRREENDDTGSR